MLYTSYFGNLKYIEKLNLKPVCITLGLPKFFKGEHFKEVAPWAELLNDYKSGQLTEQGYTELYNEYLESNRELILSLLDRYNYKDNICFVCYEGIGKFCHRHLLADFLNRNGIQCIELIKDNN